MLSKEDMETGQLREDGVAFFSFEGGGLRLKQVERFLGLAAFKKGASLEEKTFGLRV